MPRNFNKNSISKKILAALGETLENLFDLGATMIFDPHYFLRHPYSFPPTHFGKGLDQLKRSGYLKKKQDKLYITEKGREKIIKCLIEDKKLEGKNKQKWDGRWRGIIFDIPELSRKERDFLRKELKWIGFREAQKSVWLYPFDIENELKALLKLWRKDFEGDIRFILIENMNDQDLKREFALK